MFDKKHKETIAQLDALEKHVDDLDVTIHYAVHEFRNIVAAGLNDTAQMIAKPLYELQGAVAEMKGELNAVRHEAENHRMAAHDVRHAVEKLHEKIKTVVPDTLPSGPPIHN